MSKPYYFIELAEDVLHIRIKPNLKPIIKFGFWIQITGSVFIPMLYILNITGTHDWVMTVAIMLPVIIVVQYFLVTRTYLKNVFLTEYLTITKTMIVLERAVFKKKKIAEVPVDDTTKLIYGITSDFATHTLAGKTFDYYGFDVAQREINFLIEDGSMMIGHKDARIRFGKNIPSWDAKEIIKAIENFTGRKLLDKSLRTKKHEK